MMFFRVSRVLCGLLMLAAGTVPAAEDYVSPESIEGARVIDAERLIELATSLDGLVIIDSRIVEDRGEGYIEGSRHLVDRDTNCETLAEMLPAKNTPVVFYCNGINCDRSDKAVVVALGCGYTAIHWFRGGIEEWREKNYPLMQ
jgi:rhodanese-related sulfurtransferase